MRQNVYSLAVFAGGRPLCTQILPGQGRPSSHSWYQKTETLGYPKVKTASFCVPRFDTIPECDGQTDGRICRIIYSACKASRKNCSELVQHNIIYVAT